MRLICYPTSGEPPRLAEAPMDRAWMDQSKNRFAYRCLPLNIANAHGWLILNSQPFIASWNGKSELDAVTIDTCDGGGEPMAQSHFGEGVLTFRVDGLFRTEPGYNLLVTGPFNQPKDAIQPLTGIVETDWAPYTFTMNWKFTRRDTPVCFERDEPFCMIFPVSRSLLEEIEPEIRPLSEDRRTEEAYRAFARSRREFNEALNVPGSGAHTQGWQKEYFKGTAELVPAPSDHRTKIKLKRFRTTE